MRGKPSQWIKLGIALLLFVTAGAVLYRNADLVEPYFHPASHPSKKRAVLAIPPSEDPSLLIPRPKRPVYPDRPTVAILDFGVDRDTYRGEQTAIALSELIRQMLADDPGYRFVDRSEIARVREEHELGMFLTANPTDRLELGCWLQANLIVTGGFVEVGEPTQALSLSVIDTVTAERVVNRRIEFKPPLRDLSSIRSEAIQTLAEETRQMLAEANEKLLKSRDARVVSLLFFRNVGKTDRLTHLEFTLPEKLATLAESDPGVRLVRLHDPTLAMDEQELMLIGLSAENPDAWQTAADYYMWGLIEEQEPTEEDIVAVEVDPNDLPVDITLVLWHGFGDPIEIKETAAARDVDKVVERASQRAWEAAGGELPSQISLASRDEMVKQLTKVTNESVEIHVGENPNSWPVRRYHLHLDHYQIAWFLDPQNRETIQSLIWLYPRVDIDQPWSHLRNRLGQINRIIRRSGVGINGGKITTRPRRIHDYFNRDLIAKKVDLLELMLKAADSRLKTSNSGRISSRGITQWYKIPEFHPPVDMPQEARQQVFEQIADELIDLGLEVSRVWQSGFMEYDARPGDLSSDLFVTHDDVMSMILKLDQISPARRVDIWHAWDPVLAQCWLERYVKPMNGPSRHTREVIDQVSRLFANAGQARWYAEHLSPDVLAPVEIPHSQRQTTRLTDAQILSLKQQVVQLRNERKLRESLQPKSDIPRPTPDKTTRASRERLIPILNSENISDETKQRLRYNEHLNEARYIDPFDRENPALRHSSAPLVSPNCLLWNWRLYKEDLLHVGLWSGIETDLTDSQWFDDQLFALIKIRSGSPQHTIAGLIWPGTPVLFDPVRLTSQTVIDGLDENIQINSMAVVGDCLWLTTKQDGLVRYNTTDHQTVSYVGEDGLSSRHLEAIHHDHGRLTIMDHDGNLSVVTDLDAPTPTIKSLLVPGVHSGRLSGFEVIGNTLLLRYKNELWFQPVANRAIDVKQWCREYLPDNPEPPIWVKAGVDHFFLMFVDHLVRVNEDLETFDIYTAPIPPHENVLIHEDSQIVWFAYGWHNNERDDPNNVFNHITGRSEAITRSRIVAWRPEDNKVLGQWQIEAEVRSINCYAGKLYINTSNSPWDLLIYDRAEVLSLMGVSDTIDDQVIQPVYHDVGTDAARIDHEAYTGDVEAIRNRIEVGQDIDIRSGPDGWRPLYSAIRGGHTETVRILLEAGADPDLHTNGTPAYTPVLLATVLNRPDILELLHEHGASLKHYTTHFAMPVHAATYYRAYDALRWLVEHGSPCDMYVRCMFENADSPTGNIMLGWYRPLMIAIANGDDAAMDILLDAGVEPSILDGPNMYMPPLAYAISHGQHHMVPRLLAAGADPSQHDMRGATPLGYALHTKNLELAESLIDPDNPHREPEVMLLVATDRGSKTLIERLIAGGIDLNTPFTGVRQPGWMYDYSDPTTAAVRAVINRRIDLYDWMVNECELDLDLMVGDQRQGDMLACALWREACFERAIDLVGDGYTINSPNSNSGLTLLMSAAKHERVDEVDLLLCLGADPNIKDKDGKRAADLTKNQQIRELLKTDEESR